jgi:hypothetical protein
MMTDQAVSLNVIDLLVCVEDTRPDCSSLELYRLPPIRRMTEVRMTQWAAQAAGFLN